MRGVLSSLVMLTVLGVGPWASRHALAQEAPSNFLTHEELKTLFSETINVRLVNAAYARSGTANFQKDGTAIVNDGNSQAFGSWRIEGDSFCTSYTKLGSGCIKLQKTGANSYRTLFPDGKVRSTWEVQK